MGPPSVGRILRGLAGARGFKQSISQPRCIAPPKAERLTKYPSLVPAARVRGAQAIVLDLADIEDRSIAVRQKCRHAGTRTSDLVWLSEYINGSYSDQPAPSTTDLFEGSPRRFPA